MTKQTGPSPTSSHLLCIQGGIVIDPGHVNGRADVLIQDGSILEVGFPLTNPLCQDSSVTILNANGWIVAPGLVDLHCHLREPGFEYKETIATGAASAVAGGFTTICCMPNTQPVNDNAAITKFMLAQGQVAGKARVFPIGAITKKSEGEELADIGELVDAGCVAISDDGRPVMNSLVMRRALEYAKAFGIPVVDHCEDLHLTDGGCMNEGMVSTELGMPGIPDASEEVMVARNLALADLTGVHVHLAHLSTARSVELVRHAKGQGLPVSAEVCPHHFSITEEAVRCYNSNAKMNPPLRTDEDVQALKQGLVDGTIDAIATDHAPHALQEKQLEFDTAPFGIVGFETALPLTLRLVHEGVLSLEQALDKLTRSPAQLFHLPVGNLQPGSHADIVVFDPHEEWVVDPTKFFSKSQNTPFGGWTVRGKVKMTLVDGRMVYDAR
ncbi:MAG: dihydroorotase [Nitrospiraceae bacterium]|nr:dihydroorotase [Nitrospira sp.]MCB9774591.1 dihydroorotase [Nitrospiraceae bacterium]